MTKHINNKEKQNIQSKNNDIIANLYQRDPSSWSDEDALCLKQALLSYSLFQTQQDKGVIKVESLLKKIKTISLRKGELLNHNGDQNKPAYLVLNGKLSIYQNLKESDYFKVHRPNVNLIEGMKDESLDPFEQFENNEKQKNVPNNYLSEQIQNGDQDSTIFENRQIFTKNQMQKVVFKKNFKSGDFINDKHTQIAEKSFNFENSRMICFRECVLLCIPYILLTSIYKMINGKDKNVDIAVLNKLQTNFSVKDLSNFHQRFSKHNLVKDQILYNYGDNPDYGYILISGNIEVQYRKKNDNNIYIKFIKEGKVLGFMSLFQI